MKLTAAALAAAFSGFLACSTAAAVIGSDSVSFATRDQPLWFTPRTASFDFEVLNTGPLSTTIGSVGSINILNPNLLEQKAACPPLDQQCRNNVPEFVPVPHGAQAVLSGEIVAGFRGDIAIPGNRANVDFSTNVDIEVSKPDAAPGELNVISFTPRDETGSLGTRLTGLGATITGYMDESHSLAVDVFDRGDHILRARHSQTNPNKSQEILDLDLGSATAVVSAFGEPPETVDLFTSFKKGVSVPVPQTGGIVQLPLGDVTVYDPDFDLAPPGGVLPPDFPDFPATYLQNQKFPGERLSIGRLFEGDSGETDVDFARLQVDGNVWCPVCPFTSIAFEVPSPVPVGPPLAGVELRPNNIDIGAFFGIGQSAYFEPRLQAHIAFSKPVVVQDPVSGPSAPTTGITRGVDGSDLGFVMPEGDLDIDVTYSLADNVFTDILDLLISPARTVFYLGVEIEGLSTVLNPIKGEYQLFVDTFPFGDPRNVANLLTEETTLQFDDRAGSRISFRQQGGVSVEAPDTVPEPASLVMLALGLAGMACGVAWRRRL